MIRLTPRGFAVLGAAAVLFAFGQWAGYPVFLALAGAALGSVVAAVLLTGRRPRVAVVRTVFPDRVRRGLPAYARLEVTNLATRRQAGFVAGDRIGTGFEVISVPALAAAGRPGARVVRHYDLPTTQRGRHEVGPLTLDRVDPLGLGRARVATGETATLWVHPRVLPVHPLAGGHPRHHHEGAAAEEALRGSFDLREVREYAPGDETRHLHWKATARTGRLMVREYADPDQPRFTALLDTRRVPRELFEDAVDFTASVCVAATTAGHRCRLRTPAGLDVTTGGGPEATRRLLDELTLLGPGDPSATREGERRSAGGGLAVVTGGPQPADLPALARLRAGYSRVVLVVFGTAGVEVPGTPVVQASDAFDAARKWNALVQR